MDKVSIIIPTYNRAHLIGKTLDSVLAQTYKNWECIVVDDRSTDDTEDVLLEYLNKDLRFSYYQRPCEKLKGANACRNIGLDNAVGEYIIFFDSDDLMTENHLEVKVDGIQTYDCDYVITKTKYFNHTNDGINKYYQFDKFPITPHNYVVQKINWLTYDICLKTSIAKSISFNENLQSGQEYNYFSKLVYISTKGKFINKVVTLRRFHKDSIRSKLNTKTKRAKSYSIANWYTYLEIKHLADTETCLVLMRSCLHAVFKERQILVSEKTLFCKEVINVLGWRGLFLLPMVWSLQLFGNGYFFRKYLFKAFSKLP